MRVEPSQATMPTEAQQAHHIEEHCLDLSSCHCCRRWRCCRLRRLCGAAAGGWQGTAALLRRSGLAAAQGGGSGPARCRRRCRLPAAALRGRWTQQIGGPGGRTGRHCRLAGRGGRRRSGRLAQPGGGPGAGCPQVVDRGTDRWLGQCASGLGAGRSRAQQRPLMPPPAPPLALSPACSRPSIQPRDC